MSQEETDNKYQLAYIRDAMVQLMHVTYMDLKKLATNPAIWNTSPEYDISSPWQNSNMQSIFTSIYDIPVEQPPYNQSAFSQLIIRYGIQIDYNDIFPRFDAAYREALKVINKYREANGLPVYPSVEEAKSLPLKPRR